MNMNFLNQPSSNETQNEGYAESTPAEQEFALTDEQKPVNRNMIVLLTIAAIGAGLVYGMYVRGGFSAGAAVDPNMETLTSEVDKFTGGGNQRLRDMQNSLQKTQEMVDRFDTDTAKFQVPSDRLKVNPFAFGEKVEPGIVKPFAQPTADPLSDVREAAGKVKVQSILYSTSNSTCMVNNKIFAEGQQITVDGISFTIRGIQPDRILLHHPLSKFEVPLANKSELR